MSLVNPNDSSEILYGSSGDVRDEINAYASISNAGHYVDEAEVPGSLIIRSLRRSTHLINAFLEPVYPDQMPVSNVASVPKILEDISTDIAVWFTLRANIARMAHPSDDKKQQYYLDHVTESGLTSPKGTLPRLRDRQIQIPEFTAVYPEDNQATLQTGRAPIFDMDDATNYEVDPDRLDDIDRERNT